MPIRVAALCGLAAPVVFVVGIVLGDLAQPDPFDPAHDDISHLGAQTASSPWLYNQIGANLTGLLVIGLGLGLWSALGRGWAARLGSAGLMVVGVGMVLDGFLRLDCRGGIDVPCENLSWHARAHKVESGITGAALLLTPVVLAFAFRARPGWRSAWVPTLLAVPADHRRERRFASIGQGAASRAGSVAWFLWIGFVAIRLWRATTSTGRARGRYRAGVTAVAPDTRRALVESLVERYPDVPPEAVLKEDLLRTGIAFDDAALSDNLDGEVKPKSYFIFSFDQKPLTELGEAALRRPPEEVALTGGPFGLRRTIVSVRVNPGSPYRVGRGDDGALALSLEGRGIADVGLPPMPEYYRHTLAGGKTVMETAPTIQWGYLIYLTVLRLCQYFGAHEECGFCDINHNWRQHKKAGRPYTGVKPVEDVLEALALIDRYDTERTSKAYTLTGGSVTSTVDGLAEADFYGRYAQAIEERFPGRWIGKVVAQALPKADVQRFKDYGIAIYHPNYEVWDKRLFTLISPGKERYVGREEWHRRILDAAEVFGPRHVIPNFVAGVEMAKPHGFGTIDEAIASTTEGLDWFMSRGITPRFTTWCPEPTTPLGQANPDGAPLEYHIRLLHAYRDALGRHGLRPPPGYGVAGAGNAVFSVSSFMDTLDPDEVTVEEAVPA